MTDSLRHPITEDEILAYERDGVVCIRNQFDAETVDNALQVCLDHYNSDSKSLVQADDGDGGTGLTTVSTHMARHDTCFMDIVRNSPAAEIAARLIRLDEVRYFYDQLFIKVRANSPSVTSWACAATYQQFFGYIPLVLRCLQRFFHERLGQVYQAG